MKISAIVGGLALAVNESCYHGSFFSEAFNAFRMIQTQEITLPESCGDTVTGILPVLAAASVPHDRLVHVVGDGVEWSKRARGPGLSVPCALVGGCPAHATFEEKLRVWCRVNDFIAANEGSYERVLSSLQKTHPRVPPDLETCLTTWHTT